MPTSDWPVTVSSVGSVLRARTKDSSGNELGTFTADTRPTDAQVTSLLEKAAGALSSGVGADLPEHLWPQAAAVASYKAAMLVELSYFPEQVATGRSPYEQLKELYDDALSSLRAALGDDGSGAGAPSPPSYAFPGGSTIDSVFPSFLRRSNVPFSGGLHQ